MEKIIKREMRKVGYRIRKMRRSHFMSRAALAKVIHLSETELKHIEEGKTDFDVEVLFDIATALNVPITKLVSG